MSDAKDNEPMFAEPTIRIASSDEERRDLLQLRERVYVQEQGWLECTEELTSAFSKYEASTTYLVAYSADMPVGTIKITVDSIAGLPCEAGVSLAELRKGNRLVEVGHCITLPELRWQGLGLVMMREAVLFSAKTHAATHVLVDFIVDKKSDTKEKFHSLMGFKQVGQPYRDLRFNSSPLSIVAVLEVKDALARYERSNVIKRLRGGSGSS